MSVKTTEQQKGQEQQRVRESLLLTQFFASKLRELCTLTHVVGRDVAQFEMFETGDDV